MILTMPYEQDKRTQFLVLARHAKQKPRLPLQINPLFDEFPS